MQESMDRLTTTTVDSGPGAASTDEQLLLEYRATGNETLFAELVRRYEQELFSYLRRYLGNAAMADDVFQHTFLQVHLKSDQFQEGRRFRPWLYTIATHQAIDAQRRNRRHRHVSLDQEHSGSSDDLGKLLDLLESREPGPIAQMVSAEQGEWVRKRVQLLPDSLRSAVQLVYYQGLKYREAAEALSIPVGTVKSRMHTALLKLNQAWHGSPTSGAD